MGYPHRETDEDRAHDDDAAVHDDEKAAFARWYEEANKNAVIDRYSAEQAWLTRAGLL